MIGDISKYGSEPALINPGEFPEWILSETPELIVLNKPGWVVCHPSKNGPWSSLVGAAREHFQAEKLHLIARLDRETSGLVLLGRDKRTASTLQQAFQKRMSEKTYLAILEGKLEGTTEVSRGLEPDPESVVHVKQRVSTTGDGAKSQTTFIPLAYANGYTLCKVRPHTGRKHQIRAHAQWLGHSVAGDKVYGPDAAFYLEFAEHGINDHLREVLPLPRQALHAWKLTLALPDGDVEFEAPIPDDLKLFMKEVMGLDEVPEARIRRGARRRHVGGTRES